MEANNSLSLRPQELAQRAGVGAVAPPPTSLWREALWRTIDLLARFELPTFNFETHVPAFLTKARVLEGFSFFRDFTTEDRLFGPLAMTAILNLALKNTGGEVVLLSEERTRAGFYAPADLDQIRAHCSGKKFLSFDDAGFNADMRRYLDELFPKRSIYEAENREQGTGHREQGTPLTTDNGQLATDNLRN